MKEARTTRSNPKWLERTLMFGTAAALGLSGLLIAAGTPDTAVNRGLDSLIRGASLEEVAYAASETTTNREMAERFLTDAGIDDAKLVITDDERNCALWESGLFGQTRKVADEETGKLSQGGCWRSSTPDTIYLSSGITTYESLKSVTLHEYAHVLQGKGDWPSEVDEIESYKETHECLADVWAQNNGADENSLFYFSQGVCEPYRDMLTAPEGTL